ncbi:hypothetical protein G6O67_001167 [Ophiocordyceps sinensis]|nr:hypothetical protein G6O67_001167 [Ophiocordyceps sinensis]
MAELRPAPLKVPKQRLPREPKEAERCSSMWQGLSDEIGEKMAELGQLGQDPGLDDDELLERSALGGPLTPSTRDKSTLQRTASAMLAPHAAAAGAAAPAAHRTPPFAIADSQEPSGFTPRRRRAGAVHAALPDSPTLPAKGSCFGGPETYVPRQRAQQARHGKEGYRTVPSASAAHGSSSRTQPLDIKGKTPMRGPNWGMPMAGQGVTGGQAPRPMLGSEYSSFALDKSKDQDSVTILPKVGSKTPEDERGRGRSQIPQPGPSRSYFDHSPDAKSRYASHRDKAKALFHTSAPLAFQRLSTTARLASAVSRRDTAGKQESASPPADREPKPARTPSTFGHFFRKYSRTKSEHEGSALGQSPSETSQPSLSPSSFPPPPSEGRASFGGGAAASAYRSSTESLVGLQSIIDEVSRPRPPPAPPVPSLTSTPGGLAGQPFDAAYRSKKPLGLRVGTEAGEKKPRKPDNKK